MNIDEYLDLQDQTETNLLSTEDTASGHAAQEHEVEWHSAPLDTLNNNSFSNDWGLLQQNGLEGLEGINLTDLIAAGSAATAGMDAATAAALASNENHFITPGSLMKQPPPPPIIIPTVTAAPPEESTQQQEQKRVTRSRSKPAVPSPLKKKRATRAKKLYCTCQRPYNGEPMVQCDTCEEWFHCNCVDFNPDNQEDDEENIDWVCNQCKEGAKETKAEEVAVKEEKPTSTRQTRTRTQSKCLYSGCSNRTRKDSFCSDVCARKQNELETPASRPTRRTSAMRTSAQSMAPVTSKEKKNNSKQTEGMDSQQEDDDSDADEKQDEEEEFQAEDDPEDDDEEQAPQSATPDTPMSPSQMTEEENPVRRNVIKNMKAVLKSIFDVALTENADMMEESTLTTEERAEALAKSIENTMLEQLGDGGPNKKRRTCGEPYKSKFRSLLYNLKDKANKVFQIRVVTNDLTPDELVKMSSEDMANPELKSLSEVFREKGLKNSVMKIDNTPIIKKTHKGDIIMVPDKDNDNMYSEQVQQELDKINRHNSSSSSSSPTSASAGTAISPTTTNAQADTNTSKKPISSLSPTTSSTHQADPLDDILARIGIPAQEDTSHVSNKRSGSMSSTTFAEDVDPEAKKRRVTLDVEQLLGDEDETFKVDEVDTTELEKEEEEEKEKEDAAQEVQAQTQDEDDSQAVLPTIWQGRVNMPQVAEFEASARQIGGRLLSEAEWDQVLSPTMWIEGRIPSERVTNYVTQTQYSTSREIVLLEVEAKGGDANPQGQVLLNYLDSRQRYAVVGHNKTRIKDFYLIPLYKVQHIPDCLYVVRVEETKRQCDLFLGVLVLTKHVPKPIVKQPLYSPETLPRPQQQQQQQPPYQQQPYIPSSSSYQPSYGYNYNTTPQSSNNHRYGNYSSSSASSSYYRPY
ncbi:Proteasome subunit alpha type-6 [Mucor velutinosus]|uniref:Transcription factor BYE1 n=1 Tax=Mucor velutinosus TaxID=708070 RepID=A0AAN7DNZ7_9FUNG|nr:Proteasome subunit alpha type-6 [Mucor velutinosus]